VKRIVLPLAASVVAFSLFGAGLSPERPLSAASVAATQTASEAIVILAVENMTCALCPVTVRAAMAKVEGVKSVSVDFDTKTATVVFDPRTTSPEHIAAASTDAGYPARPDG
jgi:mercuric ion binding protein